MALTFEEAREWAIDRAGRWPLDAEGRDQFEVDGLGISGPLRVEAFNLLLPLALSAAGLTADFSTGRLATVAKRRGLDRAVRAGGLRLASAARQLVGARRSRGIADRVLSEPPGSIAFLSELATPSALEPSLAVARELPAAHVTVLAGDPRADRAWRGHGFDPQPLVVPFLEEQRIVARARRRLLRRWRAYTAVADTWQLGGLDVSEAAMSALRPLVVSSGPWLHAERRALAAALDRSRPGRLVLASDQHRLGRLAVDEARERGVTTLVLQHGLPDSSIGYLPVVADEVAVWSERARDWFIAGGADPARLCVLGNPRLDRLVAADRAAVRAEASASLGLAGAPRLLLTLSPTVAYRNERLTALALDWLREEPHGALVVKLHPGEGRWREIRATLAASSVSDRARVVHREPLEPLLLWADVTLLHRSTVAVESLAAGTPVVVGDVDVDSVADRELAELNLPRTAAVPELRLVVADLANPGGRDRYFAPRRAALEAAAGPLDGRTAARIATHVTGVTG